MPATDPPLLHAAAASLAGAQRYERGALYVVATPIGNLADISLRALHLLSLADAVACEDTRVGGALLQAYALQRPGLALIALHAHNEAQASQLVLARLAAGERVALISDAGTPAVSDPGARVVAAAVAAGHPVVPLPGASSALAALCVAGDEQGQGFVFVGFLPAKGAERDAALAAALADPRTQVLFEAPHRIAALLGDGAPVDGFGVGTAIALTPDAPSLGAVYKLVEVEDRRGVRVPVGKRSPAKPSFGGRKQVWRHHGPDGVMREDLIGLADDGVEPAAVTAGVPLLTPVLRHGKLLSDLPTPAEATLLARARAAASLAALPLALRRLDGDVAGRYAVSFTDALKALPTATRAP